MSELRAARLPFFSAFGFGLAAYGFCMTNKIPVGDDLVALFDKGATTVSGRYGLELLRFVMPDASMPWIYGLMSILLLSAAVCVSLSIFEIRDPLLQVLCAGVFVCFPAEAGTMLYMFTAAPYALALLLTVLGVRLFTAGRRGSLLFSPLLIAFSCSIYQGYFSLAASFCVIRLILLSCRSRLDAPALFREALKLLGMLLAALGLYLLALLTASELLGMPLLQEALNERQSLPLRIAVAYSAWLKTLLRGYFGYVPNTAMRVLHLVLLPAAGAAGAVQLRKKGSLPCALFALLCLFLYPLSCYCLYLLADNSYIHSLSLYSFASLYFLCAALLDGRQLPPPRLARGAASLALALILCGSIYGANALSLRYYLRFEELKSIYTVMLTRVFSTPGFDAGSRLAVIGDAPSMVYDLDANFPGAPLSLPSLELGHTDYTELIVSRYLGFDLPFADAAEKAALAEDPAVAAMPVYPADGSVRKIGDCVVVRFADREDAG